MMIYVFNQIREKKFMWDMELLEWDIKETSFIKTIHHYERGVCGWNTTSCDIITRSVEQKHESSVRVNDTLSEPVSFPLYRLLCILPFLTNKCTANRMQLRLINECNILLHKWIVLYISLKRIWKSGYLIWYVIESFNLHSSC
jgi:hypothetical protein